MTMKPKITTKAEMYRLLYAGRFGNYPQAWTSIPEIRTSGYTGLVSIRSKEVSNPVKKYHIPLIALQSVVDALPEEQKKHGLMFSEAPDDSQRTIQGEYDGYNLTYSFHPSPMRIAFDHQCLHATGPEAKWLLKWGLSPGDYDWLFQLLDDFCNVTIEFSAFRVPVGVLKTNCIFWEVRSY